MPITLTSLGLLTIATVAMTTPPDQRPRPQVAAVELLRPPELDGLVRSDPAWAGAEAATGFVQIQPTEGGPASQRTEVFVGFTSDALHIGVEAYDEAPEGIIVSDSRRDSSLAQTDSFRILIDGLLDRQNGYVFGTNPAGVEYDGQVVRDGDGGVNLDWDGAWRVASVITERGWSAEFEIPFSTLRFGAGSAAGWGMNFQRNIRRSNEIVFWAPLPRQWGIDRVSAAGTVTGIAPPPGRNLQLTPYLLARAERGGELGDTRTGQEVGGDLKYSLTPSLTLDATVNTDFAQVEVDDVVVNLDRFSVFFPEKRPFFLENAGQFEVGRSREVELFFSRRIGIVDGEQIPIDGGLRLSGKLGERSNVGLLYMRDEGLPGVAPSNEYTVARLSQELPNRSSIGAIYVGRDGDGSGPGAGGGDENRTYGIDGRWGIGDNLILEGWAARSHTPGRTGEDHAWSAGMDYDAAEWSSRLVYTEVREDFNPEVGFLRRDDYRRAEAFLMRRFRPDDVAGLLEIRPHASVSNYWDLDGFLETGFQHYDVHWEFRNGFRIDTAVNYLQDGLREPFEIVDDVFVQPGSYAGPEAQIVFNTDLSQPLNLRVRLNTGERFGGDRTVFSPTIGYRIGETFSSELAVIHNDFDLPVPGGDFAVTVSRLRLSYSFSPKVLLQALLQYNDEDETLSSNLRFSWLRTANSGLYLVYNESDERLPGAPPPGRELILKYSYLFDVFD